MFRKLTVLLCLLTFCPVAVNAQELTKLANSPNSPNSANAPSAQNSQESDVKLPPPGNQLSENKFLVAENQNGSATQNTEAAKNTKKSGLTFGEWSEIHFGDYRWVWWAGAAGALIAFHAVAIDHK